MQTARTQTDGHGVADAPQSDHDPFSDDEPLPLAISSRKSVRSFWVCAAGLAVFAHLMIYLAMLLSRNVDDWLWNPWNRFPRASWVYAMMDAKRFVISQSLVPCLILASVVPILYWRGGLSQRFAVALAVVVAAMNSSVPHWRGQLADQHRPLLSLLAISGCWAMFPILFLWTPIRTERLRLVVAICLLILTVCVSFINMADLRRSHEFLYWQALFGSAFVYAILRRNWGKVAMLESSATEEQIERTSSGTLLELMAVCGLASASYMYFSQFSYDRPISYYLKGSLLGVVSILVCMSCLRGFRAWRLKSAAWFFFLWLVMFVLFHVNTLQSMTAGSNVVVPWMSLVDSPTAFFTAAFSGLASFLLLGYLWSLGLWLRWCGWRLADEPV